MELLSTELLTICKTAGAESIKTKHGTVIRTTKNRYWTSDWGAFHQFILDHEVPGLLEKRISQAELARFREENPDIIPPGLNLDSKFTVTVRRS